MIQNPEAIWQGLGSARYRLGRQTSYPKLEGLLVLNTVTSLEMQRSF